MSPRKLLEFARVEKPIAGNEFDLKIIAVHKAKLEGLSVYKMDIHGVASLGANRFDFVAGFQVLEHMQGHKGFLRQAITLTKLSGKFLMADPNADRFLRHKISLFDMPSHCMTGWSKKTLKELEATFQLQLEEILLEPLAAYQAQRYLTAYTKYLRSVSVIMKIFIDRFTVPFYSAMLKTGLSNLLKGQPLYAQFQKMQ